MLEKIMPNIPVNQQVAKAALIISGVIIIMLTALAFKVLGVNPIDIFNTRAWIPVVLGIIAVGGWVLYSLSTN